MQKKSESVLKTKFKMQLENADKGKFYSIKGGVKLQLGNNESACTNSGDCTKSTNDWSCSNTGTCFN